MLACCSLYFRNPCLGNGAADRGLGILTLIHLINTIPPVDIPKGSTMYLSLIFSSQAITGCSKWGSYLFITVSFLARSLPWLWEHVEWSLLVRWERQTPGLIVLINGLIVLIVIIVFDLSQGLPASTHPTLEKRREKWTSNPPNWAQSSKYD